MRDKIVRLSQLFVLAFSILIVGYTLYDGWNQIVEYIYGVNPSVLAIGVLLIPIQMLIKRFAWTRVMSHLGEEFSFITGMKLISLFQIGSYVPGGVFHFIGISYWGEDEGAEKKTTFYGAVLNAMINLAVGLTVFAALSSWLLGSSALFYSVMFLSVIALFAFLQQGVYFRAINLVLELLDRETVDRRMSSADIAEIAGFHLVARTVEGVSLFLLIRSAFTLSWDMLPAVIGIGSGAWAVGFLVFFMPSGAGAKEVSLIYMLGLLIPRSLAGAIAVALRVFYVIWEVLIAAVFIHLDQ